jgi:hypothetical protein
MVLESLVVIDVMVVFPHDIVEGLVHGFMGNEVAMVCERW